MESQLEQANERIEDGKRRDKELAENATRLRARLDDKERQCEQLRREVERAIAAQSDLEMKAGSQAPVTKPA